MAITPTLRVSVSSPVSGQFQDVSSIIQNLSYGNAINGGFGTATFFLPGVIGVTRYPAVDFGASITITDNQANVVYEGRIEDIDTMYGSESGFQVTCAGHQRLFDTMYYPIYILRNPEFQPRSMVEAASQTPSLISMNIGPVARATTDLPSTGVEFLVANGTVIPAAGANRAALWYPGRSYDNATIMGRIKFDVGLTNNGAPVLFSLTGYTATWTGSAWSYANFYSTTSNGSVSVSAPASLGSGFAGILFEITVSSGGTTTASFAASVSNIRIMGYRDGQTYTQLPDEPVYGHEVIKDVILQGAASVGYSSNTSYVSSDSSFTFDNLAYLEPVTRRSILDYVTSFYDRYWAVWENKTLFWQSTSKQTDSFRLVRLGQCISASLKSSVLESANEITVKWQDIMGRTRSTTTTDPRPDNVWKLAGIRSPQLIDLGIIGTPSTAYAYANIAFPDRSYEVIRGQVVLPAGTSCGDIPAYRLRAGEILRLMDIVQTRDIGPTYDRKSTFLIRSVSVDWDGQTVTVDLDNSFDSLTQLQARTDLTLQARFGVQ